MGTVNGVNGGTILSFTPTPSLHAVTSRMPSHHQNGCANFTFQLPSIANASKKNTNSAERRANHNAVERARRECLNTKFQELAHALPSLAQVRRPSKSIIVQKSLEFIYKSRQRDDKHDEEMRSIRSENESLYEEINILRGKLGLDPLPPRTESKSTTPQQTDDSKDTKINTNTPEIKTEPNNNNNNHNTPPSTDAHDSVSSNEIQVKTEDSRSDDDCSNDDDFDIESSELIENNIETNQTTKQTNQHTENPTCFYDNLMYHQPLLDPNLNNHPGYADFSFTMDMSPIDHLVDANSLHLQFDHDPLNGNDMNPFCDSFSIQQIPQKYYPSPPFEATQMCDISTQIPGFM